MIISLQGSWRRWETLFSDVLVWVWTTSKLSRILARARILYNFNADSAKTSEETYTNLLIPCWERDAFQTEAGSIKSCILTVCLHVAVGVGYCKLECCCMRYLMNIFGPCSLLTFVPSMPCDKMWRLQIATRKSYVWLHVVRNMHGFGLGIRIPWIQV